LFSLGYGLYKKIKLLDGLHTIYYNNGDAIINENELVRHLSVGDYFGELAFVNDSSKRTLSMRALERVKCLVISRASFNYHLYDFKDELK